MGENGDLVISSLEHPERVTWLPCSTAAAMPGERGRHDPSEIGFFPYPVGFPPTTGADSPPRASTKQLLSHPRTLPEPLVSSLNPEGAYVPAGPRECELGWGRCMERRERLLLPKTGCRERASAGSGRLELFIDAIKKSKACIPAASALLPGAHTLVVQLSALQGAAEPYPLS